MSFRDKTKLLNIIRKVILRATILHKKISKFFETVAFAEDFVNFMKPSSFLNFQLFGQTNTSFERVWQEEPDSEFLTMKIFEKKI